MLLSCERSKGFACQPWCRVWICLNDLTTWRYCFEDISRKREYTWLYNHDYTCLEEVGEPNPYGVDLISVSPLLLYFLAFLRRVQQRQTTARIWQALHFPPRYGSWCNVSIDIIIHTHIYIYIYINIYVTSTSTQIYIHSYRSKYVHTDRYTDRQTYRQTHTHTDGHTYIHYIKLHCIPFHYITLHIHIYIHMHIHNT